ncbi:hypothetical protein COV49_00915 [Candidatus Falkowbacteria bacterium CG11_big_fil_rev_8_21_14_0_20_39_10]|uniref:PrgI family protein n=1 Tax=Candidatus Falkowbacteria bacterium CG11_big_fil_rev_8_21_14_0_20_39_10 TaxID=1974570 RepID=A0A2M6K9X9_9BACT|nr:MAG: hypothetical protein COV49_00915 [Candidatus Falkowbacteria bacterium CG11_big_fil_rev_8_21_14_0_20_39_10]
MQQFTVPQFIDVEDKIIGPVTTRQFIIMLSASLLIAISYKLFDFSLFVTASIFLILIFGVFAFARINGRPFHLFVLNVIQTLRLPNLRVWDHAVVMAEDKHRKDEEEMVEKHLALPSKGKPVVSRLAELSLIVDTQGAYKGEKKEAKTEISR